MKQGFLWFYLLKWKVVHIPLISSTVFLGIMLTATIDLFKIVNWIVMVETIQRVKFSRKDTICGKTQPVNMHPLFLFWKHGSVWDHVKKWGLKYRMQKIASGLEKVGLCERLREFFFCYLKSEEAAWPLLFLIPAFYNFLAVTEFTL